MHFHGTLPNRFRALVGKVRHWQCTVRVSFVTNREPTRPPTAGSDVTVSFLGLCTVSPPRRTYAKMIIPTSYFNWNKFAGTLRIRIRVRVYAYIAQHAIAAEYR